MGRVTVGNLPAIFKKLKIFSELFTEDEIKAAFAQSYENMDEEIDFESFLRVSFYLPPEKLKARFLLLYVHVFLNLVFTCL